MLKKVNRLISILIITFSILPLMSLACTCEIPPPPCYEYWRTDAIFVGKISKIDRSPEKPFPEVVVSVEENFKGLDTKTAITGNFPNSCAYDFIEGDRFLFYANINGNDPFKFGTSFCTRTTHYDSRLVDLEFLDAVKAKESKYWVWVTARSNGKPLAGLRAKVIGAGKGLEEVSDADGNIKITVPKKGKYKVRIWFPKGKELSYFLRLDEKIREEQQSIRRGAGGYRTPKFHYNFEVEVLPNRCGWIDFPIVDDLDNLLPTK